MKNYILSVSKEPFDKLFLLSFDPHKRFSRDHECNETWVERAAMAGKIITTINKTSNDRD